MKVRHMLQTLNSNCILCTVYRVVCPLLLLQFFRVPVTALNPKCTVGIWLQIWYYVQWFLPAVNWMLILNCLDLCCFVATGRGVQEGGPCSSHGISCCHLGSVCLEWIGFVVFRWCTFAVVQLQWGCSLGAAMVVQEARSCNTKGVSLILSWNC